MPNPARSAPAETFCTNAAPKKERAAAGTIIHGVPRASNRPPRAWTRSESAAIGKNESRLTDCARCCGTPQRMVRMGMSTVPPPIPMPPSTPPAKPAANHTKKRKPLPLLRPARALCMRPARRCGRAAPQLLRRAAKSPRAPAAGAPSTRTFSKATPAKAP